MPYNKCGPPFVILPWLRCERHPWLSTPRRSQRFTTSPPWCILLISPDLPFYWHPDPTVVMIPPSTASTTTTATTSWLFSPDYTLAMSHPSFSSFMRSYQRISYPCWPSASRHAYRCSLKLLMTFLMGSCSLDLCPALFWTLVSYSAVTSRVALAPIPWPQLFVLWRSLQSGTSCLFHLLGRELYVEAEIEILLLRSVA